MKQASVFSILGFVMISLTVCSQTKSLVKKAGAFYVVRLPGIQQVDEMGRPLPVQNDITNIIYVETKPLIITWEHAVIDGKSYAIQAERLEQASIDVGNEKVSEQAIKFNANQRNHLWRLTFKPTELAGTLHSESLILLKGKAGTNSFSVPIRFRKEIVFPDKIQ